MKITIGYPEICLACTPYFAYLGKDYYFITFLFISIIGATFRAAISVQQSKVLDQEASD